VYVETYRLVVEAVVVSPGASPNQRLRRQNPHTCSAIAKAISELAAQLKVEMKAILNGPVVLACDGGTLHRQPMLNFHDGDTDEAGRDTTNLLRVQPACR
jgi:hypothetical protein